ncbi:phage holin family protein [Altererythrobacter sp. KTW20L]|uniref:phage holin family protein n=1 Tax=Altererythrobacter sp. KTW20L TaxID=2942210 RepID=UPI0020BD9202|nr:phage holin family protein [Altererythrobacter sp. KTW20L]MCL6251135.1 phage holin family protein [Altererythrobacter sp. KTW20L]
MLREETPPATPADDGAEGLAEQREMESTRSLLDDLEDLLFDARTWLDAELTYQKTRAAFVVGSFKRTILMGAVGAVFALFAMVGLTVGLIIALTPLVTAWGSTAIVAGGLFLAAYLAVRRAGTAWSDMMDAINETGTDDPDLPGEEG